MLDVLPSSKASSHLGCFQSDSSILTGFTSNHHTSHVKGPSDGVGGVIKSFVATAACSQKVIIRDAKEYSLIFSLTGAALKMRLIQVIESIK